MSKKKVNKNDKLRVLLTDVLPYEVPLTFSNEGLYDFLINSSNQVKVPPIVKFLTDSPRYTIPYDYFIKKSSNKRRKLSIIHPSIQNEFVKFYEDNESIILCQCDKSSFSLRSPAGVASHYYEKDLLNTTEGDSKSPHVDPDLNGFEKQSKYSSSYFVYKKYTFLYKFYDSYEFHRLEKKFGSLLKFDLAKCFHSIYTHSISWAIKDKYFAKENTMSSSFENKFDKLMQKANYNETNGIVIGPEFSRIFAEIILQHIDNEVLLELNKLGFVSNSDYQVRRYVDDYFVFSNSESLSIKIKDLFAVKLENFKLYLNESKTEIHTVPYISDLSVAKIQLSELLSDRFNSLKNNDSIITSNATDEDEDSNDIFSIKLISFPSRVATKTIKDIKCIIKSNGVNYESVSGFLLSFIKRNVDFAYGEYLNSESSPDNEKIIFNYIYYCLDIAFFIYSMDCRVRTTYLIGHLIITIFKLKCKISIEYLELLEKKVFDESLLVIKKQASKNDDTIEIFNLIISLKSLSTEYKIPTRDLHNIFPPFDVNEKWTYFHITTLLFYISNNEEYTVLKDNLKIIIMDLFRDNKKSLIDTQKICLFFDLISCPYLDGNYKKELCLEVMKTNSVSIGKNAVNETIKYIDNQHWFTCWDAKNLQLAKILMKKELRLSYE